MYAEWKDALWLAKFPAKKDSYSKNIPRIEFATMTLARRCGITVPEVRLVPVGASDIFMIRRFDREKKRSAWLRHGFISALTLMQWDERDRLLWDYAAIADTMRRCTAASDIRQLFRRMVFNILVRNTDDHPRNHGFLIDGDVISLSPAYDILPILARQGVGTNFRLAMSVGAQGREAELENALSHSARFGFSSKSAQKLVAQLIDTVADWREHYEACGVSGRDIDMFVPSFVRCENAFL